jgi:hypothetical protein
MLVMLKEAEIVTAGHLVAVAGYYEAGNNPSEATGHESKTASRGT